MSLAREAVGIPAAAVVLVVVTDGEDEVVGEQRADDVGAEHRVLPHLLPLVVVEAARLEQHAVGDADLADVVQVGRLLDRLHQRLGPAELLAEHDHVGGDARRVTERVVVLGVEGGGERLEVAEVHVLDLFVEARVGDRQRELGGDAREQAAVQVGEGALVLADEREGADEAALRRQRDDGDLLQAGEGGVIGPQRTLVGELEDDDALAHQPPGECLVHAVEVAGFEQRGRRPRR